jgi:hypothetical protein
VQLQINVPIPALLLITQRSSNINLMEGTQQQWHKTRKQAEQNQSITSVVHANHKDVFHTVGPVTIQAP